MNDRTSEKSGFKRQLGGTERRFLRLPNANVVMTARIKGTVSEGLLKSAVLKVRQKHPLLGVRVSLDDDAAGWFTQEGVPEIPVDVMPRTTDDDWVQAATEELKYAFSTETGPLVRLVLLRSPEVSDLIVTAHHSICDSRSLAYLIRDIMVHLGDPDRDVETLPVTPIAIEDGMPSSVSGGFLYGLIMKRINKKWASRGISFDEDDYRDLHQTFWNENSPRILSWGLTESQTSALVSRCRKEGVTVNSAIYTAFLAAQNDVQGSSHDYLNNVLVPVDLRDRLTQSVGEAVGFYVSWVQLRLKYAPGESFWNMARVFHKKVKQQLTDKNIFASSHRANALDPSLKDAIVFARYGKLDDEMALGLLKKTGLDKRMTGILVSNSGRLDIPVNYGSLQLEAIMPPAVYSRATEKILEVITVGGKMHLTLNFGETIIAANRVEEIREMAMKYLGEAASW